MALATKTRTRRGASAPDLVGLGRFRSRRVAVVGNPNTGKSTLFNALTGLRQKIANYPGVTVELQLGAAQVGSTWIDFIDLPGMYSLAAHSPDELAAMEVLLGRLETEAPPDAVLVVVDATNLERNLFLLSQVLELDLPTVVALTMVDMADARRLRVDVEALSERLGVPVIKVVPTSGRGLEELRQALVASFEAAPREHFELMPDLHASAEKLRRELAPRLDLSQAEMERALIDRRGAIEAAIIEALGDDGHRLLAAERDALSSQQNLAEREAETRYGWAGELVREVISVPSALRRGITDSIDRLLAHPLLGTLLFLGLMTLSFQAVFSWATPLMELIDAGTTAIGDLVTATMPEGALRSLVADGVIAGVGSVIVFLPQIVILFLFILLLEDSGYMARAAFLVDRLMRACGLSGQSFIPMLSSFACAVPAILSTRVIPGRRDRLATILAAPFMTCSARLPVYALLIAAFVPDRSVVGVLNLKGLVLLGLYLLGVAGGIFTALILKRTVLRGPTPTFLIEMPPYRWPSPRSVLLRLWQRVRAFLVRAGTIIFAVSIVVWALAYFPRPDAVAERFETQRQTAAAGLQGAALDSRLQQIDNEEASAYLEQSALGRLGHLVEPLFRPLGWDWRVSSGVIASFPAREVVIAVLGTIYAVGSEVDESDEGLVASLRSATWPDGRRVFGLPTALGLMVFFALCLQCGATVAAIRRESGSWAWPAFAWIYMTTLGYAGAFLTYRIATALLT